jgi:hypothetical protein
MSPKELSVGLTKHQREGMRTNYRKMWDAIMKRDRLTRQCMDRLRRIFPQQKPVDYWETIREVERGNV